MHYRFSAELLQPACHYLKVKFRNTSIVDRPTPATLSETSFQVPYKSTMISTVLYLTVFLVVAHVRPARRVKCQLFFLLLFLHQKPMKKHVSNAWQGWAVGADLWRNPIPGFLQSWTRRATLASTAAMLVSQERAGHRHEAADPKLRRNDTEDSGMCPV